MVNQLDKKIKLEPIYSIPKASELLGIKAHALRRAIKEELVPYHLPFGNRKYVRLSEVVTAIEAFQTAGGAQ